MQWRIATILGLAVAALPPCAFAAEPGGATTHVRFDRCPPGMTARVQGALDWLATHLSALDAALGHNDLRDWRGHSRTKLVRILSGRRHLDVICLDASRICRLPVDKGRALFGVTVPGLAPHTVGLCTQHLADPDFFTATLAHEIGHLIRRGDPHEGHRYDCESRCRRPDFPQSLGVAVWYARKGLTYDADRCVERCRRMKASHNFDGLPELSIPPALKTGEAKP